MSRRFCSCILLSFLLIILFDDVCAIPPDKPTNIYPSNNAENVPVVVNLSCYVRDEDSEQINVSFFWAMNETCIGSIIVQSDSIAKVGPLHLAYNTTYYWYVVANDGEETNVSEIWKFTTIAAPNIPPECYIEGKNLSGIAPFNATFFIWAYDEDGNISSWEFDADGDGITELSGYGMPPEEIHYVYENKGKYNASLIVIDDKGARGRASIIISVYEKPIILYIEPKQIFKNKLVNLTIKGKNFQRNATVLISPSKIHVKKIWFINNETIVARIYASEGVKNVSVAVINPDGMKCTLMNAFTVESGKKPWFLIAILAILAISSAIAAIYFLYGRKRIKVRIVEPADNSMYEAGDEIVFKAVTEPPGYEEKIKWKIEGEQYQTDSYGEGSTFVTSFRETGVKQVFAYLGKECDDVLLYLFKLPHAFEIDRGNELKEDFNLKRLLDASPSPAGHSSVSRACRWHESPHIPRFEDLFESEEEREEYGKKTSLESLLGITPEKREKGTEEKQKKQESREKPVTKIQKIKLEDLFKYEEEAEDLFLIPFDKPARLVYKLEKVELPQAGKLYEYFVGNMENGVKTGFEKLWQKYVIPAMNKARDKIMEKYPELKEKILKGEEIGEEIKEEYLSLMKKFLGEAMQKFVFNKGEKVNERKFKMEKEYTSKRKKKNFELHISPSFKFKTYPDLEDIAQGHVRKAMQNTQILLGISVSIIYRIYDGDKERAILIIKFTTEREGNAVFSEGDWNAEAMVLLRLFLR